MSNENEKMEVVETENEETLVEKMKKVDWKSGLKTAGKVLIGVAIGAAAVLTLGRKSQDVIDIDVNISDAEEPFDEVQDANVA